MSVPTVNTNPEAVPFTPLIDSQDHKNSTAEKVTGVFEQLQLEVEPDSPRNRKSAEKCPSDPWNARISVIVLAFFYILFIGGMYLLLRNRNGTSLQCKPTLSAGIQALPPVGFDPNSLEVIPANVVKDKSYEAVEKYEADETTLRQTWELIPEEDKSTEIAALNETGQRVAKTRVTCLTGEPFGTNPIHAAMAALLRLPYSTETDFQKPLYALRDLNERSPTTLDNPTFVSVCKEFIDMAKLRNGEDVLTSNGQWEIADYSPWIKETKRILKPYTEKAEFYGMKYLNDTVARRYGNHPELMQFRNAPPMDQIVAVQAIRDEVTARLVKGNLTDEERKTAEIVIGQIRLYQAAMQPTARTGEWESDWKTQQLFNWLYYLDSSDQSKYSFSFSLDELQNLVNRKDPKYPETRVKDILCSLHSVAKSYHGTIQYITGEPSVVDMSSFIERIEKGITFDNVLWKPA